MTTETPELPEENAPTQPLSGREVDLALRELRGWNRQEGGLKRRFRRENFADAIRFVNAVARLADEMEHHPDIDIRFRNVTVFLTTHDVGGVTRLDLDLAGRISELD